VHLTLSSLRYLNDENMPIAFSLISKLVFTAESSNNFANQFVKDGGLAKIAKYKLMSTENHVDLIVNAAVGTYPQRFLRAHPQYQHIQRPKSTDTASRFENKSQSLQPYRESIQTYWALL